jgi:hypothetical protein
MIGGTAISTTSVSGAAIVGPSQCAICGRRRTSAISCTSRADRWPTSIFRFSESIGGALLLRAAARCIRVADDVGGVGLLIAVGDVAR